jgi:two-component system CitB family sensor kinase
VTIVGNLVDNALDAVAAGPVSAGRRVAVSIRVEDAATIVRVEDSGPGIDPDVADRIFEEGYTTKEPGSQPMRGLGLALVQQVVRRRGGEINVSRADGAVFTVRLPSSAASTAVRPRREAETVA